MQVSTALVRGVASAGSGACEFIASGERMEAKVMKLMGRALHPTLSEVCSIGSHGWRGREGGHVYGTLVDPGGLGRVF